VQIVKKSQELKSINQTGAEMARLVRSYYGDIGRLANLPFGKFFDLVRRLPYVADPVGVETISRPGHSLKPNHTPRDCDDKAVLIGAWLYANKIPFRFVAVSSRPDTNFHHTFCVALVFDKAAQVDATYQKNFLGQAVPYARQTFISGIIQKNRLSWLS